MFSTRGINMRILTEYFATRSCRMIRPFTWSLPLGLTPRKRLRVVTTSRFSPIFHISMSFARTADRHQVHGRVVPASAPSDGRRVRSLAAPADAGEQSGSLALVDRARMPGGGADDARRRRLHVSAPRGR